MAFNPRQPRGPDGKWISTGVSKARRAARSKANKKGHAARRRPKRIKILSSAASRQERGAGISGLKKNFIPYLRVSKKSGTVGFNTGSFLPGTNKRLVFGNYARLESVRKRGVVDSLLSKAYRKIAPEGSRRDLIGTHIRKNVKVDNPALRYATPGTGSREGIQARLGTSRKAGPTLIVRRGTHKRTKAESKAGIKKYNKDMAKIQGKRVSKPRPTRRRQAAARKGRKKKNT